MRPGTAPVVCVAAICLAAATGCDAFVARPVGNLGRFSSARPYGAGCRARARSSAAMTRMSVPQKGNSDNKRVSFHQAATDFLFHRGEGARRAKNSEDRGRESGEAGFRGSMRLASRGRRSRFSTGVRAAVGGAALAIIVRTSFNPSEAGAVFTRLTPAQKMSEKDRRSKAEAVALAEEEALLEAGEGEGALVTDAEEELESEELGGEEKKLSKWEELKLLKQSEDFDPNEFKTAKDSNTKLAPKIIGGGIVGYYVVKSLGGSAQIMNNQRKRVKKEAAKFNQQKEEFMDVEGEGEVDADLMKELRDLKETMAGPGDKFAKDTRAYNPQFAKDHPDELYDQKIEEAKKLMKGTNKDKKIKKKKKKSVTSAPKLETGGEADIDDLLGLEGDEEKAQAEAAEKEARKDEDLARLKDIFQKSPGEDDSPEDIEDRGELLP